ncbi:bifunctional transaldolase/phosoglucose isomerase [Conexibacter woesei]|uniref:Transaldolase n=1 Tax=Conexibacter woesei (strain DSM 14684 / CCUG 47730 / CIP 108061 / JCM 11494 / NBRC 100937 / ID131577) TaxID=469383 RepID=D3FA09_CONWI|nr:bifunctional transaldolase/phosoglucose isomerase [Conexibacter woesei]ADB53104.1 transaldolase [Conexibacter woesei DSM 14684]
MTTVPATTPVARLAQLGTSAWLDSIRRSMLTGGELAQLVNEDGVVGVTSNPSIFEQAILGSADYDERLTELTHSGASVQEVYETLALEDVRAAADVLRPVYDRTDGIDGYVSLEVAPELARDTDGTLAAARDLWARYDKPNAMIKIPGTTEGLGAIRAAIGDGINVNVTLLFSLEAYADVVEAWISGLEDRAARGDPIDRVHSVASFFVSRVDSAVDKRLDALGRDELRGRAAVANAQLAYAHWQEVVRSERFEALRAKGAHPQRLLWASTGTKDPRYPDTKYVAELAGPETVNTMPLATLLAYQDHGTETEPLLQDAAAAGRASIDAVEAAGVSIREVTDELLAAGIDAFAEAMERLLAGVATRRTAVLAGEVAGIEAQLTDAQAKAIGARVDWAREQNVLRRVWAKDDTLWAEGDDKPSDRLGWLTIAGASLDHLDEVTAFVEQVRGEGFTDVTLLGMGGSSLAPEVLRLSFGAADGYLKLHVLDTTHPDAIAALEERLPLDRTLFLVSSKSGGTLEPRSMHAHFHARVPDGRQWAAVTDPGTALEALAQEEGFRKVFHGAPDIGGRYSALSAFGVVPAALLGIDVRALLEKAEVAARAAEPSIDPSDAPAAWLGLAIGELATQGRDKLTFVVDEPLASAGLWLEQLVAESTGKHGKGIVPIADEPLGDPAVYGDDRVFVHIRNASAGAAGTRKQLDALAAAGHPVIPFPFDELADLGALFFHWEMAVAIAGAVIGINAFDQPNVQAAKDLTISTIEAYERDGAFPAEDATAVPGDVAPGALLSILDAAEAGSYVATMAYLAPNPDTDSALEALRLAIRARSGAATTVGYGPRFLHSTGQLHKGGPATGIFVQLIDDGREGVDVPGAGYDFAALVRAQAIGDGNALRSHGLPFLRIHLPGDAAAGIEALAAALAGAAR